MSGAKKTNLAHAVDQHQRGRLAEAIRTYQKALRDKPNDAVILNLLGLACFQNGDTEEGAALVTKALALKPDLPGGAYNLGTMLQALGRNEEALTQYEKAIAVNPDDFEACNNLGTVLRLLNRHADAIRSYEQAVRLRPGYAQAHYNLGNALAALGRRDEVLQCYERAIALNPEFTEAHFSLGNLLQALDRDTDAIQYFQKVLARDPDRIGAHINLGITLGKLDRPADALQHFRAALALAPDRADVHTNLGAALQELYFFEKAIPHHQKAVELLPDNPTAHVNLGNSLRKVNRLSEAIQHFERALTLDPNLVNVHLYYGTLLSELKRFDAALRHFNRAEEIDPNHVAVKFNKGVLYLATGQFTEGWERYEHRMTAVKDLSPRAYSQPRWDGIRAPGTLLVWGEQGLGDQILHAGMIADLTAIQDDVVLEVEPRLVGLFARSFAGVRVAGLNDALFDGAIAAHTPIASLGKFFRQKWSDFPHRDRGYLVANPERSTTLRRRLKHGHQAVIGLSWVSHNLKLGMSKSAKLSDFAGILRLPNCRFIDLQYGDTLDERQEVERELGIRVERLDDIDNTNDIDGLAALISACDAVVTISNTTAHLAGALGIPTWTLAPFGHSRIWYWFENRDNSPWYAKLRVRRQAQEQTWRGLIDATAPEIEAFLKKP